MKDPATNTINSTPPIFNQPASMYANSSTETEREQLSIASCGTHLNTNVQISCEYLTMIKYVIVNATVAPITVAQTKSAVDNRWCILCSSVNMGGALNNPVTTVTGNNGIPNAINGINVPEISVAFAVHPYLKWHVMLFRQDPLLAFKIVLLIKLSSQPGS